MRFTRFLLGFTLLALIIQGCELPEGPPDVEIHTLVRAPLLAEKTFVLLGPQDGVDALIDTTQKKLDTLFQVSTDNVLSIVAEQSLEDLVNPDQLSKEVADRATPDPVSIRARVSEIADQDLDISYAVEVGAMEVAAQDLGTTTLSVGTLSLDPVNISQTVSVGMVRPTIPKTSFTVPTTDILPQVQDGMPLPAATDQAVTFTRVVDIPIQTNLYLESLEIQAGTLVLTLTNRLGWDLSLSAIELRNPENQTIAASTETLALPSGASATLPLYLQPGTVFHRSLTFRFLASWPAQTVSDPQHLQLDFEGSLLGSSLTFLVPDNPAPLNLNSSELVTISDRFVTASFAVSPDPDVNRLFIDLTNNFAFTLEDGNGQGPAFYLQSDGRTVNTGNTHFPAPIPPGGTARLEIDLSGKSLRNRLTYRLESVIPPSQTAYRLQASDGVAVSISTTPLEIRQARADVPPLNLDLGSSFIDISNLVDFAVLTAASRDKNRLFIELTNNLSVPLTDGSLEEGTPPRVIIRNRDETDPMAELVFERSPGPGETVLGEADLSGRRITSTLEYELDIGTPGGTDVVFNQRDNVTVHVFTSPLEFVHARAAIPAQENIHVVKENIAIAAESRLAGALIEEATLELRIYNSLPVALMVRSLSLRNREAVSGFPAGHEVFRITDMQLPPEDTTLIPLHLQQVPLAAHVDAALTAGTPGSAGELVEISATDTLGVQTRGSASVGTLYFYPNGETFHTKGSIVLETEALRFGSGDFIALSQGKLALEDITSTLDLSIDTLLISFPGIRRPPFGAADSLVIRFIRGAQNQPEQYTFAGIPPRASGLSYQIPLEGLRVYPSGNALSYHVHGRLETGTEVRTLHRNDSLTATAALRDLDFNEARVTAHRFTANLTDDANRDGWLDLATEAEETSLEGLSDLSRRIRGLKVTGSVFSLQLTTNIVGAITLYLAMQGVDAQGHTRYLYGRQAFAVPVEDTVAQHLVYQGLPIAPDSLIRISFTGAPSPEQPVTRTFLFTSENTSIDAFLSQLPATIRLIGRAVVDGPVHLRKPLQLEASAGLTIPLQLTSRTLTVEDTLDIEFSELVDLPTDPEDDVRVEEASLILSYENGIPLSGAIQMEVLDAEGQPIGIRIPVDAPLTVEAAPVDPQGFSSGFRPGEQTITLTREDIQRLKAGRKARLHLSMETPSDAQAARLRASDAIRLRLQARFNLTLRINP